MQYVDVVSCLRLLFNSKSLFTVVDALFPGVLQRLPYELVPSPYQYALRISALSELQCPLRVIVPLSAPWGLILHCFIRARRTTCIFSTIIKTLLSLGSCNMIIEAGFPDGLPEAAIAYILRDVLRALDNIHRMGFIHRLV